MRAWPCKSGKGHKGAKQKIRRGAHVLKEKAVRCHPCHSFDMLVSFPPTTTKETDREQKAYPVCPEKVRLGNELRLGLFRHGSCRRLCLRCSTSHRRHWPHGHTPWPHWWPHGHTSRHHGSWRETTRHHRALWHTTGHHRPRWETGWSRRSGRACWGNTTGCTWRCHERRPLSRWHGTGWAACGTTCAREHLLSRRVEAGTCSLRTPGNSCTGTVRGQGEERRKRES